LSHSTVIASRIYQGDKISYLFSLPISRALDLLDPKFPFPDNRRVSKKHAVDFGSYWESHYNSWIIPPLLLDCQQTLKCEGDSEPSAIPKVVSLHLPEANSNSLRILDGQHRILGWYLKKLDLDGRLSNAISSYNKCVFRKDLLLAEESQKEIDLIRGQLNRFETEYIPITLFDSLEAKSHQQFFVDIAQNALGINKTVQAKFDSASIINRVTQEVIQKHPLLLDRVDLEKTSCTGKNKNFLTVVNVADITRHLAFGINSRVTRRREDVYTDEDIFHLTFKFFDLMVNNVAQLQALISGEFSAPQIRETSLLGSATIWRCVAGAFFDACVDANDYEGYLSIDRGRARKFESMIAELAKTMKLPVNRNWYATKLFPSKNSKAPTSRTQDLRAMVSLMAAWSDSGEIFNPKNLQEQMRL
jgi:hypothetical protein